MTIIVKPPVREPAVSGQSAVLVKNDSPNTNPETETQAVVIPHWIGGRSGYVYSVISNGEVIVSRSADPEFDAARVLLARGITGKLRLLDMTGKPRNIVNIAKGAKLRTDDTERMRFPRWTPFQSGNVEGYSAEEASP